MSKYQLIEPNIDPTEDSAPTGMSWFENMSGRDKLFYISGLVFALMVAYWFFAMRPAAAHAASLTLTPTASATALVITESADHAPSPTPAPSQTPTATLVGLAGQQLPEWMTGTRSAPTPDHQQSATQTPWVITQVVKVNVPGAVTVIEKHLEVTRIVTELITATPGPTQTPWIVEVTRIVEVTPTPTPTETPTETPTLTSTPELVDPPPDFTATIPAP